MNHKCTGEQVGGALEECHFVGEIGHQGRIFVDGHGTAGSIEHPRNGRQSAHVDERCSKMRHHRQHAFVHERFDDNQIEMFPAGHQFLKDGIPVASFTGRCHPVWMSEQQLGWIISVKTDIVTAVELLKRSRVEMCHIGHVFPRFESIPVSDVMAAAGQRFDGVEEEVRVTVGRNR